KRITLRELGVSVGPPQTKICRLRRVKHQCHRVCAAGNLKVLGCKGTSCRLRRFNYTTAIHSQRSLKTFRIITDRKTIKILYSVVDKRGGLDSRRFDGGYDERLREAPRRGRD